MQRHIDEISRHVSPDAIAVMLTDNAGWHKAKALIWPPNVRQLFIPAGCPELNAQENIWQYMRQTWLSNRVFAGYTEIIDAACDAWKATPRSRPYRVHCHPRLGPRGHRTALSGQSLCGLV